MNHSHDYSLTDSISVVYDFVCTSSLHLQWKGVFFFQMKCKCKMILIHMQTEVEILMNNSYVTHFMPVPFYSKGFCAHKQRLFLIQKTQNKYPVDFQISINIKTAQMIILSVGRPTDWIMWLSRCVFFFGKRFLNEFILKLIRLNLQPPHRYSWIWNS